jgi:Ca2+-binding RTX toxin-like protein
MTIALGGLRGRLLILCTALAGAFGATATAEAALVNNSGGALSIIEDSTEDGPLAVEEVNNIHVTLGTVEGAPGFVITERGPNNLLAGSACKRQNDNPVGSNKVVFCPGSALMIRVDVGDLDDEVHLNNPMPPGVMESDVTGGPGSDELRGLLSMPDTLRGNDADDQLYGNGGADTLEGGAGGDTMYGGDGDDTLQGGTGGDDFNGGTEAEADNGSDTVDYTGDTGPVVAIINGGQSSGAGCEDKESGTDLPGGCEGDIIRLTIENLTGTGGGDVLRGTVGANVGNELTGAGGSDKLFGEPGDDTLEGNTGNDRLQGGFGSDTLNGGEGDVDTVDYRERQPLPGTADNVFVNLNSAAAGVSGGEPDGPQGSRDQIIEVEHAETGAGDDELVGKISSNNILRGGDGNDRLRGLTGADELHGEGGTDTVSYQDDTDNDEGVTVTVGAGAGNDGNSSDGGAGARDTVFDDVENVVGGPDNDTITGSLQKNVLWGAGGDDTLIGLAGADTFFGGDEDDTLLTDTGTDTVSYQDRTANISATLNGVADDGNAADSTGAQNPTFDQIDATIENLRGGSGSDILVGDSASGAGHTGNNKLTGADGDDFLRGGLGGDTFEGGAGEDTVDYSGDAQRSVGVTVSIGNNQADDGTTAGNEGDNLDDAVENIIGTNFADTLVGNSAANKLFGLGGVDGLSGVGGDDILDGGAASGDNLTGGAGNDLLHGGSGGAGGTASDGADTLDGGQQNDTVTYATVLPAPYATAAGVILPVSPERTTSVSVVLDNVANDGQLSPAENDAVALVENAIGGQGNDQLTGSTGTAGTGTNVLDGRGGDDVLTPGPEGASPVPDTLIGGPGTHDRVDYSARGDNLVITLDGQANDGLPPAGDTYPGENDDIRGDVEDVTTGSGNDNVTGNNTVANTISTNAGNDTVQVRDANTDTVNCGPGASDVVTADNRDSLTDCETKNLPSKPQISVSGPQNPVGEGAGTATFTISIDDITAQAVTVNYTTSSGTAAEGQDFEDKTGVATIPAGQSSVQVPVTITNDALDEDNETFTMTISNPSSNVELAAGGSTGSATIADDDAPPTVTVGSESIGEGDAGNKTLAVDVTLSAPSSKDVTVKYSTGGGTATPGSDYTSVTDGTVTIPAGQTTGAANVEIVGDTLDETDETFTVTLSSPENATLPGGGSSATQTITDDDNPPTVSIGDATVGEGDAGTQELAFPVTLSAPSSKTVKVAYDVASGTAEANDYTDESGTVTFAPGQTEQTVTVAVTGDTAPEGDETITVTLSAPENTTIADGTATGTITDDDAPAISVNDVTVAEGATGTTDATFTVTLDRTSEKTVTVDYDTADGSAQAPGDYTAATGTLTFEPGQTTKQVTVPVKGDALDEENETFSLLLSDAVEATIDDATGVGTITDDDATPTLSVAGGEVTEGNQGTKDLTFQVSLSAASGNDVTVKYATSDGTATAGADYTATSGTLTIKAGETSGQIKVPVTGDTAVEGDETFTLTLTEPQRATLAQGKDKATGTIKTDDTSQAPAVPAISIADVKVAEGDTGTTPAVFTVSLSVPTTVPVTVNYATADGTAKAPQDYQVASGPLTFAPGERTKTITVNVLGDRRDEADEQFTVALGQPGNGTLATKSTGIGTITDDESPRLAPKVSARTTPGRDRSQPYRFTTRGKVTVPRGVRKADGCAGKVQIRFKAASKTISTRRVNLRRNCTFSRSVTFGIKSRLKPGRLKVEVRFLGNAVLLPKSARVRFVRAG